MISLDTETTGLDLRHAARPFFVTICKDDGTQIYYEWPVDPLTREPHIPQEDIADIKCLIKGSTTEIIALQNAKFDAAALDTIGISRFPWERVWDTIIAGHLLCSNKPHNLTDMAIQYLGINIEPYEKRLQEAVKECRRRVQQARLRIRKRQKTLEEIDYTFEKWFIAASGAPGMPSAGKDTWKEDMWLPAAFALWTCLPEEHHYWSVLRDYSNADSSVTLMLMKCMESEIKRRGLWEIYLERLKALPVAYTMEKRGVTVNASNLVHIRGLYKTEVERLGRVCVGIADSLGHTLELPKGASPNNSLRTFFFDVLKVEKLRGKKAKTDAPTLDKGAMEHYLLTLPAHSKALTFVRALLSKRARDTSLAYMAAYERFWKPTADAGWYVLHPSLNPTGTDTLRWSSSNPNEQNISKKDSECQKCKGEGCDACGGSGIELYSVRMCFGPAPGREWWSCDGKNLELRIPSYEADEREMITLFEKPNEPPYFGSNHLLNFHTAYPDIWEDMLSKVGLDKVGLKCKKDYGSTWYQWCKNGGFALQYGGGKQTVDLAFHKAGVYELLSSRFARLLGPGGLNERCIRFAEKYGYVETMPDKSIDPKRGYPLMCTRTEWGKILNTVPLNYRVQGTACWWMMRAMNRCQEQLDEWNKLNSCFGPLAHGGYHIALQVHDELVFDFPKTARSPVDDYELEKKGTILKSGPNSSNLWRIRVLQKLMEKGGEDIGVPTPVSAEYHAETWAHGVTM